jgi:hypothetical protein
MLTTLWLRTFSTPFTKNEMVSLHDERKLALILNVFDTFFVWLILFFMHNIIIQKESKHLI